MATIRVYRSELTAPGNQTTIRVYRAEVSVSSRVRVYRAEATATGGNSKIRVYRAEATVSGLTLGPNLVGVEPWTTVTLTAAAPDTPTSWTFNQVSGPAVTLVPLDNTVSFVAPPSKTTQTVVLSVTAHYTGGATRTSPNTSVEILYATEYINIHGVWSPCRIQWWDAP